MPRSTLAFLVVVAVLPYSIVAQATDQDVILVDLREVSVEVDVVVSYDDPSLVGEVELRDRLQTAVERELREAGMTVTDDATSDLVFAFAVAPINVGGTVGGVAVSSILQLKESAITGRMVDASIRAAPAVGATSRAWRAAYWDLARDTGFWGMPVWSGPLGVVIYPVDNHRGDLEQEAVRLTRIFTDAHRRANPR